MSEKLEEVLLASFDREYEQDENLVRSLPFFATALGVVVAIYGQILNHMPARGTFAHMFVEAVLLVAVGGFLWVLFCLFQAVRRRQFIILSQETTLHKWWHGFVDHEVSQGKTKRAASLAADRVLSATMQHQYSAGAVHNRAVNMKKMGYRTSGIVWLVVLMVLATAAVCAIFFDRRFNSAAYGDQDGEIALRAEAKLTRPTVNTTAGRAPPAEPAASAAVLSSRRAGSEVPGRASGRPSS